MIVDLFFLKDNTATVRERKSDREIFWVEMGFVQWFLIRILTEFYESQPFLPDTLAALYLDREFLEHLLIENKAELKEPLGHISALRKLQREWKVAPYMRMSEDELESEIEREEKENRSGIFVLRSGIFQKPIFLDPHPDAESGKNIRAVFPECRMEFKGFGRFFGFSDINQAVFWAPMVLMRHFYLAYGGKGREILTILSDISGAAGKYHAKREITMENQRELALEGIQGIMKNYVTS